MGSDGGVPALRGVDGAQAKSNKASTCKRYAPAAQREKISKYRAWFHDRRRPPRE
jgi:hypothetical protein